MMTTDNQDHRSKQDLIEKLGRPPRTQAMRVLAGHALFYVAGFWLASALGRDGGGTIAIILLLLFAFSFFFVLPINLGAIYGNSQKRAPYKLARAAVLAGEIYPEKVFADPFWTGSLIVDPQARKLNVSGSTYGFDDVNAYSVEGATMDLTTDDGRRSTLKLNPELAKDAAAYLRAKLGF